MSIIDATPGIAVADLHRIAAAPAGAAPSFAAAVVVDDLVYTSGQLPLVDGALTAVGLVGRDIAVEEAAMAARACAANALAAAATAAAGRRIERVVKMTGFVASAPGFNDQPAVMNAASAYLHEVFGAAGEHVRSAIGAASLPRNAAVEVELVVRLVRD
ncbi:RidA family protein [Microbacterium sp.]|uniref:RidA family protein n=1 Tax=Microbacterium sp. TaxID=51671 RepID=UPI0039E2743A